MSVAYDFQASSVREKVSPEEWRQRVDLAAVYRLMAMYGWDDLIFTHISARVPGPHHHFLLNPYGMMFEEVTASSLVKVDLDGNKVMESDYAISAPGFVIHSAIHRAREDAQCVIHLHSADGVAVSSQEHGLLPLNQHAMSVCWDLAYHEYEGIAIDLDEQQRLVADLGNRNHMILRNHGTLAVGDSCASAFLHMYFLERSCTMQIRALSGPLYQAPAGTPEHVAQQIAAMKNQPPGHKEANRALYWEAALRKLDRIDPSYKS